MLKVNGLHLDSVASPEMLIYAWQSDIVVYIYKTVSLAYAVNNVACSISCFTCACAVIKNTVTQYIAEINKLSDQLSCAIGLMTCHTHMPQLVRFSFISIQAKYML